MAPLTTSLDVQLLREAEDGSGAVYSGSLDQEWTIGSVPNGGYSLSAIINAAQAFQRSAKQDSRHVDPFHCAATYLAAAQAGPHEVHLTVLKKGRGFTNLEAKLVQRGRDDRGTTRILAHLIMTSFAARQADASLNKYTIQPDNKFHISCPITPPSRCSTTPSKAFQIEKMSMRNRMVVYSDREKNKRAREEGRLAWGAWMDCRKEDERRETQAGVSNNAVALFADMTNHPQGVDVDQSSLWFPTLQLSLEFKRALPQEVPLLRMGIFSTGKFSIQGQTDQDCEVWSHPDDAELLGEERNSGSHILAMCRQVALTLDISVNKGFKDDGKKDAKLGRASGKL